MRLFSVNSVRLLTVTLLIAAVALESVSAQTSGGADSQPPADPKKNDAADPSTGDPPATKTDPVDPPAGGSDKNATDPIANKTIEVPPTGAPDNTTGTPPDVPSPEPSLEPNDNGDQNANDEPNPPADLVTPPPAPSGNSVPVFKQANSVVDNGSVQPAQDVQDTGASKIQEDTAAPPQADDTTGLAATPGQKVMSSGSSNTTVIMAVVGGAALALLVLGAAFVRQRYVESRKNKDAAREYADSIDSSFGSGGGAAGGAGAADGGWAADEFAFEPAVAGSEVQHGRYSAVTEIPRMPSLYDAQPSANRFYV